MRIRGAIALISCLNQIDGQLDRGRQNTGNEMLSHWHDECRQDTRCRRTDLGNKRRQGSRCCRTYFVVTKAGRNGQINFVGTGRKNSGSSDYFMWSAVKMGRKKQTGIKVCTIDERRQASRCCRTVLTAEGVQDRNQGAVAQLQRRREEAPR